MVRTDGRAGGRAVGRAVYGHVLTKFSGMDRFSELWDSAHARGLCARVELRYYNGIALSVLIV